MSAEVNQILKTIEEHSARQTVASFLAETKLEKWLLGIAAISLIFSVVLLFFEPYRMYGLLAGLTFLLATIVLSLVQAFSLVAVIRRPLKGYAEAARERIKERTVYVSALAKFSAESLFMAKRAIESDSVRLQKRLGLLLGAVEKAGFIPAGLALYYAAQQATSASSPVPSNLLMGFVFGLYAGAYIVHRFIEALRFNISCIEEAHKMSLSRERLRRPNQALAADR